MSYKILTLTAPNEFKFKEKGSLFIGYAFPTETIEEAESELMSIRKKHYDATHNCYAYQLFDGSFKYSDDGEPNGTAGIRILNAIKHFELINTIVVVTRYYGGTKLGVGPLGKAYYDAAFGVLDAAKKCEKEIFHFIEISFEYDMLSNVHHFLTKAAVVGIEQDFSVSPKMTCYILPDKIDQLRSNLTEVSKGKIELELIGTNFLK